MNNKNSNNNFILYPLFAVPLYVSKISSNLELDREKILEYVKQLKYTKTFNADGKITEENYILDLPAFICLKKEIESHIETYCRDILKFHNDVKLKITNSFILHHSTGNSGSFHKHSNSIFSGVVYLNVDKNSGGIIFHRMNIMNILPPNILVRTDSYNEYNSELWTVKPDIGDVFIFPSFLYHSIEENNSSIDRYSLSFNTFLEGPLIDVNDSMLQYTQLDLKVKNERT